MRKSFDDIIQDIYKMGLNLYDLALYTEKGIQAHRFQICNNCNNSYSVAKVFVVTALGLLWQKRQLDVGDSIYDLFKDRYVDDVESAWQLATIEHAMTHKLGFDEGFLDIDVEDVNAYSSDDYLQLVLTHPLRYLPGTHSQYSDAAYYLLSRIVSQVAGETMDALLFRCIFRPMGFQEVAWSRCPHGYPMGATGLYISSEDMVKLGALYLNGGIYNGQRLLSKEWVDKVIENEYELHSMTPGGLIGKGGMYGQALIFSQKARFAVAWHGHMADNQDQKLVDYFEELAEL